MFANISRWLWTGKQKKPGIPNGSPLNPRADSDLRESDYLNFPLLNRPEMASSSRRVQPERHSRKEPTLDREFDAVLVPSDDGCVSGSESDDLDYDIGWFEPHRPEFQCDNEADNHFAVLVPCYGHVRENAFGNSKNNTFGAIVNIEDEGKKFAEQFLSSLKNS